MNRSLLPASGRGDEGAKALLPLDGYVRVSRVGPRAKASFISPDLQEEQIRAYAAARSREVGLLHVELDRSGTDSSRPRFREALRRVCEGESGGVIVAKLDRFGRSAPDALDAIRQIHEAGGEFASVEDGFDSSTPFGKAMMTILLALAELEVARIREGWEQANRRAVGRGIHPAPYPATGYKRSASGRLVPDFPAASAVAEIFKRRAGGASYDALARFLEESEVITSRGNRTWTGKTVFRMITNPVYTGEARYGQFRNANAHEPLVSRHLWISVQPGMPGRAPRANAKSLLAGLIRCAGCSHAMAKTQRGAQGEHKGLMRNSYCCRGLTGRGRCPAPAYVAMGALDAFVTEKFFDLLAIRERREADCAELDAAAHNELVDTSVRGNARAEGSPGVGAIPHQASTMDDGLSWSAFARHVRAAQLAQLPPREELRQVWASAKCSVRRTYLASVFDAVIVAKGRRQLENRVRLVLADDLLEQAYAADLQNPHAALQVGHRRVSSQNCLEP